MRRAFALVPLAIIAAGLYIIVGTPDVITHVDEIDSSHMTGVFLIIIGLAAAFFGALIADTLR